MAEGQVGEQGWGESGGGEPREGIPEDAVAAARDAAGDDVPPHVEVWNDYDPSMRFVAVFPLDESQGATAGSVVYYIIEPGKHTGAHGDNAEEIVFVTEGEGEAFLTGTTKRLEAGTFVVFPAGMQHDVYAHGMVPLRLLSFFPTVAQASTFQQVILPMGGNVLTGRQPVQPVVTELDPDNLPEGFPFVLDEAGLRPAEQGELTLVQRMIGLTEPGQVVPPGVVITPGEEAAPAAAGPADEPDPDGEDASGG